MPSDANIQIPVAVRGSTIVCGQKGGHARGCGGNTIQWDGGELEFTLQFSPLVFEKNSAVDLPEHPAWPFQEAPPADGALKVKGKAVLTLREQPAPAAFKYSITVGALVLDPIIIVDKKT